MNKTAIIALGGNALSRKGQTGSIYEQFANTRESLTEIREFVRQGYNLCLTHGNGDIKKPEDVLRMFEATGCNAVMVARAALGNPWFFKQAAALLNGSHFPPEPETHERISMCRRHMELLLKSRGKKIGTNLIRKRFGWYIKGFPGAAVLRQSLVTAKDRDEMTTLLNQTLSTSGVTSFASV